MHAEIPETTISNNKYCRSLRHLIVMDIFVTKRAVKNNEFFADFLNCFVWQVNLSVAIIPMSHQLGWNASTAGLVQSSFFWGYALSQLPGGWLAKKWTGR